MPGNIRVAVLEAVDLPSTVTDGKSVAVKVSVGRREFQTTSVEPQDGRTQPWNSEYLFPVLNLRDNLLVSLMDSKGDVVARAELDTPEIVQKGFQDAFIALKAGGRIHMKVSFVLSDEERRKIEAMRLAALKKRKGLNQSFKSRRAPLSNVKITEISAEEAENMNSAPGALVMDSPGADETDALKGGDISVAKAQNLDDLSRGHSAPKLSPTTSLKSDLSPTNCEAKASIPPASIPPAREGSDTAAPPLHIATVAEGATKCDGGKHKILSWLSRRQHDNRMESGEEKDGKWLEDMNLKSKIDKSTSVKAAKADEWIKNLDRAGDKPGVHRQLRPKKHLQEEKRDKSSRKTVKQKLEDWRAKELGPWRRTSKVRHASPPGSDSRGNWLLRNTNKSQPEKELSSAWRAERQSPTLHESPGASPSSCSPANHRKASGGVKHIVKQVLTGAAVVAGAFVLWPRKASSKPKERFHIVQEGETLSSIVPDEWEDPDSNFYRLNPQIRDKHVIYPGQRIRLG